MSDEKLTKSDAEWAKQLTSEQFRIARQKGTERAFTGAYWDNHGAGMYRCICCDEPLFASDSKFDSGTGWPSFDAPVAGGSVETEEDRTLGMRRVEVHCRKCGAHLGHLFDDGPTDTGVRYCINSASLKFDEASDAAPIANDTKSNKGTG